MRDTRPVLWTNGKKRAAAPEPAPSLEGCRSLSQAKLDRICRPTAVYHWSYFRWYIRLSMNRETYPAWEMKAYLQDDLGPEVCRLGQMVRNPPETMTGAEWEVLEDRWQRKQGQADALAAVLDLRAKEKPLPRERRLNLGKRAELAKTTCGPAPSTTNPDPHDPFSGE